MNININYLVFSYITLDGIKKWACIISEKSGSHRCWHYEEKAGKTKREDKKIRDALVDKTFDRFHEDFMADT